MTWLVDSNVLCEPTRAAPSMKVVDWLRTHEGEMVVDAIVLGEVRLGILTLAAGRKRARLEEWFAAVTEGVECLPWDAPVSQRWASLVAHLRHRGRPMPLLDSMIAATALEHGLTVATRNVRDFELAGVDVVDPFA
jgi:predicted nucleic acid-binding protein